MGSMEATEGNPVPPASGGRARAPWIVVAGIYFVICFACAQLFSRFERNLALARTS